MRIYPLSTVVKTKLLDKSVWNFLFERWH